MNEREAIANHFDQVVQQSRASRIATEEEKEDLKSRLKSLFYSHPNVKSYIKWWATLHPNMTLQQLWNIAREA